MIKEALLARVRSANGWLLRIIDSNDKIIISKNFTDAELLALLKNKPLNAAFLRTKLG